MDNNKGGNKPKAKRAAKAKVTNKAFYDEFGWQALNSTGSANSSRIIPSDYQLLFQYQYNPTVRTVVDKKANAVAQACLSGLKLYKVGSGSDGKTLKSKRLAPSKVKSLKKRSQTFRKALEDQDSVEEVLEHPVLDALATVSEGFNGFDLWFYTCVELDVLGRAYWLITVDDELNNVIKPLPPQNITRKLDDKGRLLYYEYKVNQNDNPTILDKENVIEFKTLKLDDLYNGYVSVLSTIYAQVIQSTKLTDWLNNILDNRATIQGTFINTDGAWDGDAKERFEYRTENKFTGRGAGKFAFLDGNIKFIPTSYSPTDLAPVEIDKNIERVAGNAFGVPEALLGKDATYSNAESARQQFATDTITPLLVRLEEKLNESLLPHFEDGSLFIAFDSPASEDQEFELKEFQAGAAAGVITVDEARAELGYPPLEDEEKGSSLLADLKPAPAPFGASSDAGEGSAGGEPENAAGGKPEPEEGKPEGDAAGASADPAEDEGGDASGEKSTAVLNGFLKLNEQVTGGKLPRAAAISLAAKLYRMPEDEARKYIGFAPEPEAEPKAIEPKPKAQACSCGQCSGEEMNKANPLKNPTGFAAPYTKLVKVIKAFSQKQRAQVLGHIKKGFDGEVFSKAEFTKGLPAAFVDIDDWTDELDNRCKPICELFAQNSGSKTLGRVGASPDVFHVAPQKIREAVAKSTLKFCKETNAATTMKLNDALDLLKQKLRDGIIDEGQSIPELTKVVNEVFDNLDKDRAELIAQTETQRAVHEGQRIAAKESGMVKGFKLLVSSDACPLCLEYSDKEVGIDEKFNPADSYDDSLLPIHPACRCTMLEVLDDSGAVDDEGDGEGTEE